MNPYSGMSTEDVCERGQRLIDERLSPQDVERLRGQIVVVDVVTGEMEFDKSSLDAGKRLRQRVPNPTAYIGRVGHAAAYRMGFAPGNSER